jgi:hypothetical protein
MRRNNFLKKFDVSSSIVIITSFDDWWNYSRHGELVRDHEFMKKTWLAHASKYYADFWNKKTNLHHIQDLPSSQNTLTNGEIKMNTNIHKLLKIYLHNCTCFTICLGKATDTTSSACLAIILWFVNNNEVLEELYKLNA